MGQSDTGQLNPQMPPVTKNSDRTNRHITPPAVGTAGLASVISIFFIGLVSGAAGGLLLGATAVVMLQSLELLAENTLLMDQLEKYFLDDYYLEQSVKDFLQWEHNLRVHDIRIAIFVEMFGVFSSALSLAVGIYIGSSTYSLVIKKKGKAAMEKALAVAGPACLTSVTATGYILGLSLERFLSITLNLNMVLSFFIPVVVVCVVTIIVEVWFNTHSYCSFSLWIFTPTAVIFIFTIGLISEMRLTLVALFIPMIIVVKAVKSHSIKLTTAPVPLMLTIYDIYSIAGQQIVVLQSPTSKNTSSVVLGAIFIGVLASLMWTVTVGMSLFVSLNGSGAGKIYATAATSGAAVLGVIQLALPVLGPGPTIGALMGVAGAVGVSLSAAVGMTDQYGLTGRFGVTVGAVVGAFLCSYAHIGLSALFMGLCAATIPAGAYLVQFLHAKFWRLFVFLWLGIYIAVVLLSFTHFVWFDNVVSMFFIGNIYMGLYMWFLSQGIDSQETFYVSQLHTVQNKYKQAQI